MRATLAAATELFLLSKAAEGRSPHTLSDYRVNIARLTAWLDKPAIELADLDAATLRRHFAWLATECVSAPQGCARRPGRRLSPKTVRNAHAALSSFWTWALAEGIAASNPMRSIARPRAALPTIEPLTHDEVRALLRAVAESQPWQGRPETRTRRATAWRDRAIVLLLLDTGIRASELCALQWEDFDAATGHIAVRRGKGGKPRTVRVEKATTRALLRYRLERVDLEPDAPLLAVGTGDDARPLTRRGLALLLARAGSRAGVRNVHAHRIRHTFAIEALRNGMDVFSLMGSLGHSSLDMTRRYLAIVQMDLDTQHRAASPVRNWRL